MNISILKTRIILQLKHFLLGDGLFLNGFQKNENGGVIVLIKEAKMGEVQLILAPLALHKVFRQHKDGLVALLDGVDDVVDDPFAGNKVPLMQTQLEGRVEVLQLLDHQVLHPVGIVLTVGHKGIIADIPRGGFPGLPLGLEPGPHHFQVPQPMEAVAQDPREHNQQEEDRAHGRHQSCPVAFGDWETRVPNPLAAHIGWRVTQVHQDLSM